MALPVILVDSATGSDTQASGAGPATALFGASGVTSADGLTVSLLTDNPDLSGVPTDGSAVLFMSDTNAGSRNFGKITAVDNTVGVKTVTVANAFQALNTDAWAIGGKRASVFSGTSLKLTDNNGGSGDALPGWIIEWQSGHVETMAGMVTLYRSGDTTFGPIVIRGKSGAAAIPVLTFTNNGNAIRVGGSYWKLRDFEMQNTNGTKTASVAIIQQFGSTSHVMIDAIRINHATNKFWKGINASASNWQIRGCDIANCANLGIYITAQDSNCRSSVIGSTIRSCGAQGIYTDNGGNSADILIYKNKVVGNTGDGVVVSAKNTSVIGNTIDGNGGDGIEISSGGSEMMRLISNIISNNGGFGFNFNGDSDGFINAGDAIIESNTIYNNTSGASLPATITIENGRQTLNPTFVGGGDYTPTNASLAGTAYPASLP